MSERLTILSTYVRMARLYWRWAPSLLLLALLVFVPVGLIHAVTLEAELGSFDFDGVVELLGVALAVLALAITGLLGEVFYTGAVAFLLTNDHDGRPPSPREIARTISYGRLIVVDLIYGIAVAIGLLLLVAPGAAAFVWFALAAPIVEIEDRGVRAAFARSVRLIRGRFWAVLAVLLPIEIVGDGGTTRATELATDLLGENVLAHWLADVLANLAFTPFYAVAAVVLTVVLIREKEGAGPRLHSAPAHA
jgi:hypothetical protein